MGSVSKISPLKKKANKSALSVGDKSIAKALNMLMKTGIQISNGKMRPVPSIIHT
jgi:hypothetical protein